MLADYMSVDLSRRNIIVAEQFRNSADVGACSQHMRGEGMAERMAIYPLSDDAGLLASLTNCLSHYGLMQVVAAELASNRMVAKRGGWKQEGPAGFSVSFRIFSAQANGHRTARVIFIVFALYGNSAIDSRLGLKLVTTLIAGSFCLCCLCCLE